MGRAISPVSGMPRGRQQAKGVITDAAKMISLDGAQLGGMLQKLVGDLHKSLDIGEDMMKGRAAGTPQGMLQSFQKDVERLAFIHALQKAISKAGNSKLFNLETAINDLWVAMDGVKRGQKAVNQELQEQARRQADVMQAMSAILEKMHETSKSVIQNMR